MFIISLPNVSSYIVLITLALIPQMSIYIASMVLFYREELYIFTIDTKRKVRTLSATDLF